MNTVGEIQFSMLLNTTGFASGINAMINMLAALQRNGKQALNFQAPPINLSNVKAQIDGYDNANKKVQESIRKTTEAETKHSAETEKVAASNQKATSSTVSFRDALANTSLRLEGIRAIFTVIKTPMSEFIAKYEQFSNANKGLTSIALFKGLDVGVVNRSVQNLEMVRKGLLSVADASKSLQNLLSTNYTLEDSIIMLQRLGDAAAFSRQESLSFGDAVRSATEGIKNGNSVLVDNAGVTKNLSVMLTDAGLSANSLMLAGQNAGVRMAILNGIIKETAGQVGNASKLMDSDQGNWVRFKKVLGDVEIAWGKLLMSLTPILTPIQVLLTALASAPDRVKGAAMSLFLLTSAFVVLNGAIPNPLKLLSVLFTVIMSLPDGFRLLGGAVMVLAAAMIALNGPIQVMSISLGGLPIIFGMLIGGAVAIKASLDSASGSIKKISEVSDETARGVSELNSSIEENTNLLAAMHTVQERSQVTTALNKDEQTRFDAALQTLNATIPDVFNKVDLYTDTLDVNTSALTENIKKTEEKIEAEKNAQSDLIIKNAADLINATEEQTAKYNSATQSANSYKQQLEENLFVGDDLMMQIAAANANYESSNRIILENVSSAKELKGGMEALVKTMLTAKDPEKVWMQIEKLLRSSPTAANAFENAIKNASNGAVTSLSQVLGYIRSINKEMSGLTPMGPDAPTPNNIGNRIKELQDNIGNSSNAAQNKLWQKQIDAMEKQRDNIAGITDKTGGSKNKKDLLDDAIEKIEKQIKLYEVSLGKEGLSLQNALKELESNKKLAVSKEQQLNYAMKHYELENKITDLRERKIKTDAKESDSLSDKILKDVQGLKDKYEYDKSRKVNGKTEAFDDIGKLREAINLRKDALGDLITERDYYEMIKLAKDKIQNLDASDYEQVKKGIELKKDIVSWEGQILTLRQKQLDLDNDIAKRRIQLIVDEFDRRRAEAELEYSTEIARIEQIKNLNESQKEDLLQSADGKRKKTLKEISEEEMLAPMTKSREIANDIQSIFNFAGHTFLGKFLQAFEVTDRIVKLLNSLELAKGIFSFLGTLLGLVPGIPGPGELPIGPNIGPEGPSFGRPGNMPAAGSGILSRIISGSSLLSSIASRTSVSSTINRAVNNNVKFEVADTLLKGDNLYLQWRRVNNRETKRTKGSN